MTPITHKPRKYKKRVPKHGEYWIIINGEIIEPARLAWAGTWYTCGDDRPWSSSEITPIRRIRLRWPPVPPPDATRNPRQARSAHALNAAKSLCQKVCGIEYVSRAMVRLRDMRAGISSGPDAACGGKIPNTPANIYGNLPTPEFLLLNKPLSHANMIRKLLRHWPPSVKNIPDISRCNIHFTSKFGVAFIIWSYGVPQNF